jgi:hypothetical protein
VVPVDQNQAVDLAQMIINNTNDVLKHEHIKIAKIFSETGKDTITAMDFITLINE